MSNLLGSLLFRWKSIPMTTTFKALIYNFGLGSGIWLVPCLLMQLLLFILQINNSICRDKNWHTLINVKILHCELCFPVTHNLLPGRQLHCCAMLAVAAVSPCFFWSLIIKRSPPYLLSSPKKSLTAHWWWEELHRVLPIPIQNPTRLNLYFFDVIANWHVKQ